MKLAAFAILLAQLSYGPFTPGPRDRSFAVGVAPRGMLVAWSEVPAGAAYSVIHVGVIDFEGQWISPIRTLAPAHADAHVTTPAIATDGERFFVAWIERDRSSWAPSRVFGALVDASGMQITETFDLGRAANGSPSIVWDGLTFRSHGPATSTITQNGALQKVTAPPVSQRVPFATPDANGWIDWINVPAGMRCGFSWCTPTLPRYTIEWAVVSHEWIRSGRVAESGYNGGRPAVLAQADEQLVLWSTPAGLTALPIVDGRAGRTFRLDAGKVSEPAAAESLVVYEKTGDVYGTVLVDGSKFGDPFPIATSEQWETLPRVYLVGPNRYLVTWIIDRDPAGVRMAGRFVSIE